MEKHDITLTNFGIKKVLRVIRAENKQCHKQIYISGRPNDVFVYIISGSCDYKFEDGGFTVGAGDIMYLAKGEKYTAYIKDKNYRFIYCDFEFEDMTAKKSAVYKPKNAAAAEKLFTKVVNVYKLNERTYFADSLSLAYGIYSLITDSTSERYVQRNARDAIEQAKNFIDTHYGECNLCVRELAKKCRISEVYFRKLFKSVVGVSPSEYIISTRLKHAKHLIKYYPFLSLEECAVQCGFSSSQYFSRIFKSELGITPSKYRNDS